MYHNLADYKIKGIQSKVYIQVTYRSKLCKNIKY